MPLKKRSKKDQQRLWRPDFRDRESLPDTKVIRTTFLLNFVAITITTILVGFVLLQEYNLRNTRAELEEIRQRVLSGEAANRNLLDQNRDWLKHAAIVQEAVKFHYTPVDYSQFLRQLAVFDADGLVFSSINLGFGELVRGAKSSTFQITMAGKITGGPSGSPSEILTRLQDQLRDMPELNGRVVDMNVNQFSRDNELGVFNFSLGIRIDSSATK